MIRIFSDFLNLIYPNVCNICDEKLVLGEKQFCAGCLTDFPKTGINDLKDNPVARIFWGRVNISGAYSLFYFIKGSKYQTLLHKIKYKGEKELGIAMGRMIGTELFKLMTGHIDYIVPVPLHKRRLRARGYNQSELIAKGIAEAMKLEILSDGLIRQIFNPSQTKRGRIERWENVEGIFRANHCEKLRDKHILLVDDVITTGATFEACITALNNDSNCKISVASLAYTK